MTPEQLAELLNYIHGHHRFGYIYEKDGKMQIGR
jgi:hypothetical protein